MNPGVCVEGKGGGEGAVALAALVFGRCLARAPPPPPPCSPSSHAVLVHACVCVQPAVPLNASTRYVIGVSGVTEDVAGRPLLSAWPAFAALRDSHQDPRITVDRRVYYENNIFPVLEATGMPQASLQM